MDIVFAYIIIFLCFIAWTYIFYRLGKNDGYNLGYGVGAATIQRIVKDTPHVSWTVGKKKIIVSEDGSWRVSKT